jgi:hypothetical protein
MVNPAAALVVQLADTRRAGQTFEDAWPAALSTALRTVRLSYERDAWSQALAATRESWRAAFERRPVSDREAPLVMLLADEDPEPLLERERLAQRAA